MTQLAALTNKPSDNYAAEMLFRVLGARRSGTGLARLGRRRRQRLIARRFGIRPRIYNGSGESGLNRTSPRELVRLLIGMSRQPIAGQFESSLPVVGRSGTLSDRLRGTVAAGRCKAKDGTLTSPLVGTAAGYCRTVGGHTLAVAIMTNGIPIHFDRKKNELTGWRSRSRIGCSPRWPGSERRRATHDWCSHRARVSWSGPTRSGSGCRSPTAATRSRPASMAPRSREARPGRAAGPR